MKIVLAEVNGTAKFVLTNSEGGVNEKLETPKRKRNQWLDWLRGAVLVIGLLSSGLAGVHEIIDLAVKIMNLLHF